MTLPSLPRHENRHPDRSGPRSERLAPLARTLTGETVLVRELGETLVAQRSAVAAGDPEAMLASTDQVTRLLSDLEQARADRGTVLASVTGDADLPLSEIETRIGGPLPGELARARAELSRAADTVDRELRINHHVLGRALASGEAFFTTVLTSLEPESPVYGEPKSTTRPRAAVIVNKVV